MFLSTLSKKIFLIAFLAVFLLVISHISVLAASESSQNSQDTTKLPATSGYKIVPIPPANSSQQVTPIPSPTGTQNVQLAGNPFGWIKDRFGDLFGLAQDAAMKLFEAGCYIVEHTGLNQIVGDMIGKIDEVLGAAAVGNVAQIRQISNEVAQNPDSLGNSGLLGLADQTTNNLLALQIPVSSTEYFASINPFKQASAESGEEALASNAPIILNLWVKVRDMAIALSVVIVIVIGFMIMLRFPINPRTVVTIQNSLPRIVIALILIVFSFAIAGLMVDLTRIVAAFLSNLITVPFAAKAGISGLFFITGSMLAIILAFPGIGGTAAIVMLLLLLILAIIILVVFIILIFKLVTRYVTFLLLTIFAPLFFLVGALPGAGGVTTTWFKRAAASLLAIPFTGLVISLSLAIGFSGFTRSGTVPDFKALPMDLFGGLINSAFGWFFVAPIVGLGLFFFALKVPDIVDQAFNILPLGGRGGKGGFGAVIAAPMGALRTVGTVTKAAPVMGAWGASMANSGGITGRIGSGVSRLFGTFDPNVIKQRSDAAKDKKEQQVVKQEVVTRTGQGPAAPSSPVQTRFSPSRGTNEEAKENPPNKG